MTAGETGISVQERREESGLGRKEVMSLSVCDLMPPPNQSSFSGAVCRAANLDE